MVMKPLASVREYHYWSQRLVSKLWDDNATGRPVKFGLNVGMSNLGLQIQQPDPLDTKAAQAKVAEEMLSDHIVTDLDYSGPLSYLAGQSQVVLSGLQKPDGDDTGAVTLFSDLRSPEGKRVALCLFGSAHNVCGCDPELPAWRRFGWTSSSSEGVDLLLRAGPDAENSSNPDEYWQEANSKFGVDTADICWDAQNICANQGTDRGWDNDVSWQRGYTLGPYNAAEWLARIYYSYHDADVEDENEKLRIDFDV